MLLSPAERDELRAKLEARLSESAGLDEVQGRIWVAQASSLLGILEVKRKERFRGLYQDPRFGVTQSYTSMAWGQMQQMLIDAIADLQGGEKLITFSATPSTNPVVPTKETSVATQLLYELARGLEGGEAQPLSPLVRKAARLAAVLGEDEYRTLFQLHLDGIGASEHARAHVVGSSGNSDSRRRALSALLADRDAAGNAVAAHPLPTIEEFVAKFDSVGTTEAFQSSLGLRQILNRVRNRLGLFVVEAEAHLRAGSANVGTPHPVANKPRVFIGHGRSRLWLELRDFLRERLGLESMEFNHEPAAGMTVTERLEEMLDGSCFAFLVMTAEDQHADGSIHARENVVHEVGLCQGRFGRRRAIVLLEEGCAEFSNIVGLVQLRFLRGQLLSQSEEIRRILEREEVISAAPVPR